MLNDGDKATLPVKESYGFRNLIAHHYDSIDIPTISEILEFDIPDLKETLNRLGM